MRRIEFVLVLAALPVFAQGGPERVTVPFSDPARPGMVRAEILNGSITVKAHNGKDVIILAQTAERKSRRERDESEGLKRITIGTAGLEVEEQNNVMTIETSSHARNVDLEIQVPVRTSLKLGSVNGRQITVEGVEGDIEADSTNGSVTLTNVSGSAVAHALNGPVKVTFARVDPKKAMAFSSLNGRIDVAFPADVKANLKIKTEHGELYSDFDINLKAASGPVTEDNRGSRGKYRLKIDNTVVGTINGGGPEYQFSNMNGSIYIRKAGGTANQ
jgi:DUF4097 and DUF4098 domain-containing protein YvlB